MKAFATLLDRLVLTPSRNGKLKLLTDYFRDTPDPDRGYGLAAISRHAGPQKRQTGHAARAGYGAHGRGAVPLFL